MAKMSGGEALVKSLVREGVEAVFGIGGIHMSGPIQGHSIVPKCHSESATAGEESKNLLINPPWLPIAT